MATRDELLFQVAKIGNLAEMTPEQRQAVIDDQREYCEALGVNYLMRPVDRLKCADGTYRNYINRGGREQLRKIHRVSTKTTETTITGTDCTMRVVAWTPDGRQEDEIAVVSLTKPKRVQKGTWRDGNPKMVNQTDGNGQDILIPLNGEERANAIMKCGTKAKGRVTLAICGIGAAEPEDYELSHLPDAPEAPAVPMFTGTAEEATANLFGDDPAPLPSQGPIFLEHPEPDIPESEPYSESLPPEGPNFPESEPDDIPEGEPGGEVQDEELAALFVDELKERMTARNKYSYQAVRGYVLLQYKVEPEQLNHGQRARVLSWTEPERIGWLEGELQKSKGEIARVLREASKRETVAF